MLNFPAIGIWRPGQITSSWTQSSCLIIPEVEQLIEQEWKKAMSRPGVNLFDGPMCRLESMAAREGSMQLALSRTSYKVFVGTNMSNPQFADKYGRQILANPVGLSAIVLSVDGFLMMGRRNDKVAYYPDRIHPFAGCLEPHENLDVFDDMRRELREELSFGAEDLSELLCIGVAEDLSLRQPELIFLARSLRTREQIESRLDPTEHHGVWAIADRSEEVEQAMRNPQTFTPVAQAAMLLWGRLEFGQEWFQMQLHDQSS